MHPVTRNLRKLSSISTVQQSIPIYCKRHPPAHPAFLKTPKFQKNNQQVDRKIRVLVDMDGVIADFEKSLIQIYQNECPNLPVLPCYLRRGLFIDKQYDEYFFQDWPEAGEKLRTIMKREHFFKNLPPIPEAVNKIHCLLDNPGYDVSICTSPLTHNVFCTSEKLEWLDKFFGNRFHRKVIMTNDKTLVNADFLLDDKEHIEGAIENPSFEHILVRQQHNQHVTSTDKKNILESWNGLDDLFENLISEKFGEKAV